MSVYSRTNAAGKTLWRYDFNFAGARYVSADPHYASEAKATAAQRAHKKRLGRGDVVEPNRAKASNTRGAMDATAPIRDAGGHTLAEACALYWQTTGRHHRSHRDIKRRLAIVERVVGQALRDAGAGDAITEIRYAIVMAARELRRAEPGRNGQALAAGTVNLDLIDQLRPVLNQAALTWETAMAPIDWKKLRLKSGDRIVREYAGDEIAGWDEELPDDDARFFLHLMLTYGPRLGELFFPPDALGRDAKGRPVLLIGAYLSKEREWRKSRKDGSLHELHLLDDDAAELAWRVERAKAAGWATIWSLDACEAPASYYQMRGRIARASKRAQIRQGRVMHGARHHAGTQAARTSILHAKDLLGHRQISTTDRYSHLDGEDMRDAVMRSSELAQTEAFVRWACGEGKEIL